MKIPFTKPWMSLADQLRILRGRGLDVADSAAAERFLSYVNYYRFSGFCLQFQRPDPAGGGRVFVPGTTFDDVKDLCVLDRRLRDSFSAGLELVEISLRARIAYTFSNAHGPLGHSDPANFDRRFSAQDSSGAPSDFATWTAKLHDETARSREPFVEHFRNTYAEYPTIPIWVATELCSFGSLSKMYSGMAKADMNAVSAHYGLQSRILASWLHVFTYLRNVCAHHGRLWDKWLAVSPALPPSNAWNAAAPARNKIAIAAHMLNWMLSRDSIEASFHGEWHDGMQAVLDDFSARFPRFMAIMGFPAGWQTGPLWKK